MARRPHNQGHPDHDTNDTLTVFKADWDIVVDPHVYYELGMLVSPDNGWTISDPQIVGELRWGNPEYGPFSIGYEYAAVSERNDVGDDDLWVNRRSEAWYKAASRGNLKTQRSKPLTARSSDLALIVVCIVFFVVFVLAPFVVEPAPDPADNAQNAVQTAVAPTPQYYDAAGTPVPPPTPTPLPTLPAR